MEHDIGCKIKAARIEKKLTQEQVAELLSGNKLRSRKSPVFMRVYGISRGLLITI